MVTYWSAYSGTSSTTVTGMVTSMLPRYVTVSSALFASTNTVTSTNTLFTSAYQTASANVWIDDVHQTITFAQAPSICSPHIIRDIREIEWPAPLPRPERPEIVRAPAAPAIIRSRASQERRERRDQAFAARQAEVERALWAQREIERRAMTERERARQAAEAEQARIQAAAANAARAAAEVRARELLISHLTPEQRASVEGFGWFVVEGGRSKKRYQIHLNRVAGNIREIIGQNPVASLCCHCDHSIPPSDQHLAQKLMLEHREDEFLRIANRTLLQ